jgi:[ribosomal protein S18]-alanine N-acetyltransferase
MSWPRQAWHKGRQVGFAPLTGPCLETVAEIDKTAYAHPWRLRHFADSLASGYAMEMLAMVPDAALDPAHWVQAPRLPDGRWLLAYVVAMPGVEEAHLLNLTTVPVHQRQGWGRYVLQALRQWACLQGAQALWLEVRASHQAARALYASVGFEAVGLRKGYYPDRDAQREDAVVMRLDLAGGLH